MSLITDKILGNVNLLEEQRLNAAIQVLDEGLKSLLGSFQAENFSHSDTEVLQASHRFLCTTRSWVGKMPYSRLYDILMSFCKSVHPVLNRLKGVIPPSLQKDLQSFHQDHFKRAFWELGPHLQISLDKMSAFVRIRAEEADIWDAEKLVSTLGLWGISHGIQNRNIQDLFLAQKMGQSILAAHGTPSTPGDNAELSDLLHIVPKKRDDSDWMIHFKAVTANQAIYRKVSATRGEPGRDIYGEVIPSVPGLDVSLPDIVHCSVDSSRMELKSTIEGVACWEAGRIYLVPAVHILDDDKMAEPLTANKAIFFKGDVVADAQVYSGADIFVEGSIAAATLEARGSLICKNGIQGRGKSRIHANRIVCKYIQEANVICEGPIHTQGALIHPDIMARQVVCSSQNGLIMGGRIQAWDRISASTIGSESGITTEILLKDETESLHQKLVEAKYRLELKRNEREKLQAVRKTLIPSTSQLRNLNAEQKANLEKLQVLSQALKREIENLHQRVDQLKKDILYNETSLRRVCARTAIYPGVQIQILDQSLRIKKAYGPSVIMIKDGYIQLLPYDKRLDEYGGEKTAS